MYGQQNIKRLHSVIMLQIAILHLHCQVYLKSH